VSVTGIVAALTAEARTLGPVRPNPGAVAAGSIAIDTLPDGTLLVISGMGAQAATEAALALVAAGAHGLLSFGLAGALDPTLRAGALLLPEAVTDGTAPYHRTCAAWRQQLAARAGPGAAAQGGTLLSVAQPLLTAAAKAEAWRRTGARGVDMESFAIAGVALRQGLSFAVARVVVDTAADGLPRTITPATGSRGAVNYPQLLAGLLRSPADVLALLRLAQRYRVALAALRQLGRQDLRVP
jgi:adenosylhomocysteine nucleosidase